MTTKLTVENLQATIMDCMYREGEYTPGTTPEGAVIVEGITRTFGFHPDRLQSHLADIEGMLGELPDVFMASGGGGYTFLDACMDRHGNQWTGMHPLMEELFILGIAVDRAEWCLPREAWNVLPGRMPYVMVKNNLFAGAQNAA